MSDLLCLMVFSKYDIWEGPLVWSLHSQCAISTCCPRQLNPTFSLVRRLLASQSHVVIERYPSCDRVQVIALNCNLNQGMVMFDDVLSQ